MDESIDELIIRGYRVKDRGENNAVLKARDWGSAEVHLLIAVLTGWWTFGLANAIFAIYKYVTAEEIRITVTPDDD